MNLDVQRFIDQVNPLSRKCLLVCLYIQTSACKPADTLKTAKHRTFIAYSNFDITLFLAFSSKNSSNSQHV